MTDKELIKQEIERLKHNTPNAYDLSRFMLLEEIESFINSTPEQSGCEVNFTTKSEDLEEAASKYVREDFHERSRADFKEGDEWQKQQMMKDAVEGEYWIGEIHLDTPIIQGYDDGDRIKFVPIKYEQQ